MPEVKKMQAPAGFTSGFYEGQEYQADSKGQVKVAQPSHEETLRLHGFTDVVESSETPEEIRAMDPDELREYIEERGGTVQTGAKRKQLKIQALRAGGFSDEADSLEAK